MRGDEGSKRSRMQACIGKERAEGKECEERVKANDKGEGGG